MSVVGHAGSGSPARDLPELGRGPLPLGPDDLVPLPCGVPPRAAGGARLPEQQVLAPVEALVDPAEGVDVALCGTNRHHEQVKRAVVLLVVLLVLLMACSSGTTTSTAPTSAPTSAQAHDSWLAMGPEDVRAFDGPGGELLLIFVDESYDIDGTYASALTWKLGDDYTTDYFVEDDSGSLWWYGRKGSWRAGRHGEQPRLVLDAATAGERALVEFGDLAVTLERGSGPVRVETPQGVYEPDPSAGTP